MCYVYENTTRGERIKRNFNLLLFVHVICCISLRKCIFRAIHSFLFSPLYVPSLFACVLHCSKHFLRPLPFDVRALLHVSLRSADFPQLLGHSFPLLFSF